MNNYVFLRYNIHDHIHFLIIHLGVIWIKARKMSQNAILPHGIVTDNLKTEKKQKNLINIYIDNQSKCKKVIIISKACLLYRRTVKPFFLSIALTVRHTSSKLNM